jgi:hypothetical protein
VEIARVPNRPDFAVAKKPCARDRPENFGQGCGVVVGHAEETVSAPVAGENERGKGLATFQLVDFGQLDQIGVRGDFVPQLLLLRLPRPGTRPDRDRAGLRIGA